MAKREKTFQTMLINWSIFSLYPRFGPWTWVQPILNGSQSWSLQSYAVFWKAVSDFMLSSDYVWLSVAGVKTLTDRRDWGRGLCCQEELAGLWNIPFAEGNEEIPRRPALSHRNISSLQTTESSYRYRANRLQASNIPLDWKRYDGDCLITVFQEMMQVIIRRSKAKTL